jgi:hypothetical protein
MAGCHDGDFDVNCSNCLRVIVTICASQLHLPARCTLRQAGTNFITANVLREIDGGAVITADVGASSAPRRRHVRFWAILGLPSAWLPKAQCHCVPCHAGPCSSPASTG